MSSTVRMIGKCSSPLSLLSHSIDPFPPPISTNAFLFLPSRSTDIQHRHRRQLHRFTSHHQRNKGRTFRSFILNLVECPADYMFKGIYNGRQCHAADIPAVLARAWSAGVDRIIVTTVSAALAPHMYVYMPHLTFGYRSQEVLFRNPRKPSPSQKPMVGSVSPALTPALFSSAMCLLIRCLM